MTRAELITALAGNYVIVAPNKLGVTAAALDAAAPGASSGLALVNPGTDAAARGTDQW
jgi:hypothetical protein